MTYLTVPLDKSHKRKDFSCTRSPLNVYLHTQVSQDIKRKVAVCFVFPGEADRAIVRGYYTLSNDSISRDDLPEEIRKKFGYKNLPTTLLGRLAVDSRFERKGFGELILMDALKRCYYTSIESIASMAIVVDPLDEEAVNFYKKYGFILLPGSGRMFLPMDTVKQLFV
jgi:GNAT superfamily N-acetyltransferase